MQMLRDASIAPFYYYAMRALRHATITSCGDGAMQLLRRATSVPYNFRAM